MTGMVLKQVLQSLTFYQHTFSVASVVIILVWLASGAIPNELNGIFQ